MTKDKIALPYDNALERICISCKYCAKSWGPDHTTCVHPHAKQHQRWDPVTGVWSQVSCHSMRVLDRDNECGIFGHWWEPHA